MRLGKRNGAQKRRQTKIARANKGVPSKSRHPAVEKLAAALKEYKRLANQHAATTEILRAIAASPSPGDAAPVFEAILRNATKLCEAHLGLLNLREGERLRTVAQRGGSSEFAKWVFERGAFLPDGGLLSQAMTERRPTQVADARTSPGYMEGRPNITSFVDLGRVRTFLAVPLVREAEVIGNIGIYRPEVRPFTDKQIALVTTFAAQAVIAIENARLFNETKEALGRQTATADILKVISSSPTDVQPVFEAVAERAAQLCSAENASVLIADGDVLRTVAAVGAALPFRQLPIRRTLIYGRAFLERRTVHVEDVVPLLDSEYPDARGNQAASGFRTLLCVPMTRDGNAIGAIGVWRREVKPFTQSQIELMETFAAQAVIAIENVRLFNETKEALQRQTATSDILKVISSSPTDVRPVFGAIVDAAKRLIAGKRAGLLLRRETEFEVAASSEKGVIEHLPDEVRIVPLDRAKNFPSRAILDGEVVHVPDWEADEVPEFEKLVARTYGIKSGVVVPLLRQGQGIGALAVTRAAPGAYHEKEIELLRSFADQAVIAIENARLFNETKESLEQQTATARILGVMSSSPTDVQPVLDAVAESAARLCETDDAIIRRVEPGGLRRVAHFGPLPATAESEVHPIVAGSVGGRAVLECRAIYIADTEEEFRDDSYAEARALWASAGKYRTMLAMPLVREGTAIGVILCRRREKRPFSYRQITLLKTFADQAVIAIENVRLFNETKEALEQQTAVSEILRIISSSPADVQPVLDAVAERAARICAAPFSDIVLVDRGGMRVAAGAGDIARSPPDEILPLDRTTVMGRSIIDRTPIHIENLLEHGDEFPRGKQLAVDFGHRTLLAVPLVREDRALGTILVRRTEVRPFEEKHIALLKTFADQAAIAIENVRLFNETREALERQTATADILAVISRSQTDVQPVFETIARNAVKLCSAVWCAVFRVEDGSIDLAAHHGFSAEALANLRRRYPGRVADLDSGSARCARERAIVQLVDVENLPGIPEARRQLARIMGFRTQAFIPMLRQGACVGVIGVTRPEPEPFPDQQIALLQTFADQAVIAIENVRLFNETKEALEQQTGTTEILEVISKSPTDARPVFDIIADQAVKLCAAEISVVSRFDGELIHLVASRGVSPKATELMASVFPMRLDDETVMARTIRARDMVHVPDVLADPVYAAKHVAAAAEYRSCLGVPMMRAGEVIGGIFVGRAQAGLFSDKQLALLQTFAAQAVIAVENVRLFKELQERTEALTKSVDQLTALGKVGQAITSTLELETVLKTIVAHAVELTGVDSGAIYEYDEGAELFRLQAAEKFEPELVEAVRRAPIRKGDGATGRIAVTLEAEQVPDIEQDSYRGSRKDVLVRAGYRAVLAVPLLRENHLLGALQVFRRAPGAFAPEVVELLKTFATQSALAIQNARLYREIEQKSRELETASRHKSQFLASMSHELRTPLNAILGFNEMILDGIYGELTPDVRAPLENIQSSGKHLLRLINNVLDLAKIEAGRMELALSDYSVQDTVASVHSTLKPLAAEKGLQFVAEVPADIPLARGDSGRIAQCLMNLAGNSLKFTKEGRVAISVTRDDGLLRFSVADTGIGIPAEKIPTLFTEFKQTDAAIASEYGGTGLGLSITKKFIEMHGGRIWVESEPGKGSSFQFEIPLRAVS